MKTLLLHAPEKKGLHTPRQSRVENVHIFWIAAKGKSADPEVAGQIFAPPLESPLWGSGPSEVPSWPPATLFCHACLRRLSRRLLSAGRPLKNPPARICRPRRQTLGQSQSRLENSVIR